ncbi:MAG: hypothetical protein H6642_00810 [Caldilineaceae bacterium]|nr:hypothetical protein [Caldilineaceae bacterium]
MLEMTIRVSDSLAEELGSAEDRMPEILAYGLGILSPLPGEVYQYILEFLTSAPSQEEVVNFEPNAAMQARVTLLLEKNRTDTLSAVETKELDEYMRINHLVTMLKARALPYLVRDSE